MKRLQVLSAAKFFLFIPKLYAQNSLFNGFFVVAILLNIFPAYGLQESSDSNDLKALLKQFFLVRSTNYVDLQDDETPMDAIIVLDKGYDSLKNILGQRFFVLFDSQQILKGDLSEIANRPLLFGNFGDYSIGRLRFDKRINWQPDTYYNLLAVQGKPPPLSSIIQLKSHSEKSQVSSYLKQIKSQLPTNNTYQLIATQQFSLNGSNKRYVFISVEHYDVEIYKTAGDKALNSMGFLFASVSTGAKLIEVMPYVNRLLGITDINRDGVFEFFVSTNAIYDGTYEILLFDGQRFLDIKRILYEWGH